MTKHPKCDKPEDDRSALTIEVTEEMIEAVIHHLADDYALLRRAAIWLADEVEPEGEPSVSNPFLIERFLLQAFLPETQKGSNS